MTIGGITAILFTMLKYVGSAVIGYFVVKNAIRDALKEYGNKEQ
ncbi:hypothetical protein [Rhodohalobacter sulfatireducens]|nr:hypothetical protein [Rhodohalobacter sulfatireducens]MDR9367219.1 hypothetical protein [Balneolaceae bacterium]MDR9409429.1 hypothetical protein [Balneolaceae bacterium]